MNSVPPKVTVDLQKNSEISKIISDGIRAAEALEAKITSNTTQLLNNPEIYPKGPHPMNYDRPHAMRPFSGGSVPAYLRPPPGSPGQKFRRPLIPMHLEKRPMGRPHQRPFILPQPSLIVSHYKKPPPNMFQRHYTKPHPMQQIAPLLLLGEASEIKMFKKPVINPEMAPNPIDLPYAMAEKYMMQRPMLKEKPIIDKPMAKITAYKPPFELRKDRIPMKNFEGFKPETVVVEGGFKPIVRRRDDTTDEEREHLFERNDRVRDDIDSSEDIHNESVFVKNQEQKTEQQFEPMFKPSPLESVIEPESKAKQEKLTGDLKEMNVEDGEDKMAMAAEQYETVYPEGSVVTYDGKAVIDASLLGQSPYKEGRGKTVSSSQVGGPSNLEILIKKPQFGPFRGEIPPLIPEFANYDHSPALNSPIAQRNDTEKPISTKLTIVRPTEEHDEVEAKRRLKRDAHHHPDHQGDHEEGLVSAGHSSHLLLFPLGPIIMASRFFF